MEAFLNLIGLTPHTTPQELAQLLGTDYSKIKRLYYRSPITRHYHEFNIPKKNGDKRKILAPSEKLKTLQLRISALLNKLYDPRAPAKAFIQGRSIVDNAAPHCRKSFVFNIDLNNFFPSITFGRVRGLLMAKPYSLSSETATVIAHLSTVNGSLPQGSPCSPVISNMICAGLDRELYSLAREHRAFYTRYADDITFSFYCPLGFISRKIVIPSLSNQHTNHYDSKVGELLNEIIISHGFTINQGKVRLQGSNERQVVTGLTTNQKPNVPRTFIRKTAALIHSIEKTGLEQANLIFREKNPNSKGTLDSHIRGRLLYIKQVVSEESVVYRRLAHRYNMLPISAKVPNPAISAIENNENFKIGEFIKNKCWIVNLCEDIDGDVVVLQGTAFTIKNRLLVTCAHVLQYSGKDFDDCEIFRVHEAQKTLKAKVIIRDNQSDIAILKILEPPSNLEPFTLEEEKEPNIGERVAILGFPNFKEGATSVGILRSRITNKYPLFAPPVMHSEVDKTLYAGNSGGPVINSSYHVVGIASKGAAGSPTGQNSFIRISELIKILERYETN
ncbi:trypsin-like peptidase domain-containing protein [Metapseudomonas otitidis]|uniref:trypsin-like peptidase domain-containing protein n=1 Tax=Metapseudomonas otitidis TaxID=319939 RepID=UPI001F3E0519|nr:trypsin-like peptidase domain-containing protein [Pseudomonas otitidis]